MLGHVNLQEQFCEGMFVISKAREMQHVIMLTLKGGLKINSIYIYVKKDYFNTLHAMLTRGLGDMVIRVVSGRTDQLVQH